MKDYAEIKRIITEQLGITDLASYKKWGDDFWWTGKIPDMTPRGPSQEDIDLLSPDAIDNNAFWRIAEELFKTDPVSNCGSKEPFSVEEANRNNLGLYHVDGFTGLVDYAKPAWDQRGWKGGPYPLLEIGPGYGAFKEWLTTERTGWDYYATDVYPRIAGVDAALTTGLMAPVTLARRYAIVVASNVFQHLSVDQRRAYYADIAKVLMPQGYFMVSMMLDAGQMGWQYRCKDGGHWCRHYGQFTRIQREGDIMGDLERHFKVERRTICSHGWIVVQCTKK